MEQPVIIYPSRFRLVALVLAGLGMTAMSVLLAFVDLSLILRMITVYIGIPFFSFATLYALYRLLAPRPSVVLTAEGIVDNASATAVGLIHWYEIDQVAIHAVAGQRMLGITVRDLPALLERIDPLKRSAVQTNLRLGFPPVSIPQNMLAMPLEELLGLMEPRLRARGNA